jgi:hypothetical protein
MLRLTSMLRQVFAVNNTRLSLAANAISRLGIFRIVWFKQLPFGLNYSRLETFRRSWEQLGSFGNVQAQYKGFASPRVRVLFGFASVKHKRRVNAKTGQG